MGAEERQPEPNLAGALEPYRGIERKFSFYGLVYLLQRLSVGAPQLGQTGPVADERVRFRSDPSLVFQSSDITAVDLVKSTDGATRARVTVSFMGLYGSVSPLPTHFSETIALQDYQGGPQPIRELFDVLHHRLLSLLYRAWAKYRLPVGYVRGGTDPFTKRMFCAVGVDAFAGNETALSRFLYLRYAPLLASKSRSARALDVILQDLFGQVGVHVDQFIGQWVKIEKPLRNKLGVMNHQLGESLTIGRWVYDGTGRFNIVLGPLGYDEYLSFLPGGHRRPLLRSVCDTVTRGMYDVMLELHVKTDAAPRFQLGSPRASTLKRTAWLGGSGGQAFVITVPLDEDKAQGVVDEDDDDRGEPPPS